MLLHTFSINRRLGSAQTLALTHMEVLESVRILDESSVPIMGYVRCGRASDTTRTHTHTHTHTQTPLDRGVQDGLGVRSYTQPKLHPTHKSGGGA